MANQRKLCSKVACHKLWVGIQDGLGSRLELGLTVGSPWLHGEVLPVRQRAYGLECSYMRLWATLPLNACGGAWTLWSAEDATWTEAKPYITNRIIPWPNSICTQWSLSFLEKILAMHKITRYKDGVSVAGKKNLPFPVYVQVVWNLSHMDFSR